jgi:hypothetical protein
LKLISHVSQKNQSIFFLFFPKLFYTLPWNLQQSLFGQPEEADKMVGA